MRALARGPLTTGVRGISAASEVGEVRESGSRVSQVGRFGLIGRATIKELCRHLMLRATPTAVLRPILLVRERDDSVKGGRSALVSASPSASARSAIRVVLTAQKGLSEGETVICCHPLRAEGGSGRPSSPCCASGNSKVRRASGVSSRVLARGQRARSERPKGRATVISPRPIAIMP